MGQLVTLCAAPNEYIAIAFERALHAAGIPCVQLTTEIPMRPGFNFGAGCYADILVNAADESRARAVLDEIQHVLCGEDHDCQTVYPSVINLRSNSWIVPALLCVWGLSLGIEIGEASQASIPLLGSYQAPSYYVYWSVVTILNIAIVVALLAANWPLAKRTALHLGAALLALLVLPYWLLYLFLRWVARLPLLPGWLSRRT